MTDTNTGQQNAAGGGAGRASVVLGGGLAAVLLAAVGATGGWLLAGEDDTPAGDPLAVATTSGAPTSRTTAPRPSSARPTPSAVQTSATPTKGAGLTVPPVIGTDFEQARDALRKHRLGWRLVFGSGVGRTVESTTPDVGSRVARGTTVQLQVAGPAPAAEVPDVVGETAPTPPTSWSTRASTRATSAGAAGRSAGRSPPRTARPGGTTRSASGVGRAPSSQPTTKPTP